MMMNWDASAFSSLRRAVVAFVVFITPFTQSAALGAQQRARVVGSARLPVEGSDETVSVRHLLRTANNKLFAVLPAISKVLILDSLGRYRGELAHRGAIDFVGLAHDTLYLGDSRSDSVAFYTQDGRLARRVSLSAVATTPTARLFSRIQLFADGRSLVVPLVTAELMRDGPRRAFPVMVVSDDGRVLRTLGETAVGNRALHFSTSEGDIVRTFWGGLDQFADNTLFATMPDRLSVVFVRRPLPGARGEALATVVRVDTWGDTIFSRRLSSQPVAVPRQYLDSTLNYHSQFLRELRFDSSSAVVALRQAARIGQAFPPVVEMVVGHDGTIWLKMPPRSDAHAEWHVLGPKGDSLARVLLPWNATIVSAGLDRVWVTRIAADGGSFLDAYQF